MCVRGEKKPSFWYQECNLLLHCFWILYALQNEKIHVFICREESKAGWFFFSKLFNVFVDSISSYFAASMVHNLSYRQSWSKFSNLFLMRFVTGRQELINSLQCVLQTKLYTLYMYIVDLMNSEDTRPTFWTYGLAYWSQQYSDD